MIVGVQPCDWLLAQGAILRDLPAATSDEPQLLNLLPEVPDEVLTELVDEVFLPLVRGRGLSA
ncbi:hypothetical protein [Actinomadura hibisca]|uniref:hypothetical protein n=1 Tax=Actinomadura hibisca TaxID=68565 RepID=UPI00083221C7|nr:hypothetical protein [Actinomadura hibisca]